MDFPTLDIPFACSLESPFIEEEIFKAIKDSNGDKGPGSDSFPFRFAKSFCHVFKEEMVALF